MVRSARARPKGRRSHSAPQDLNATALRLDSTGARETGRARSSTPQLGFLRQLVSNSTWWRGPVEVWEPDANKRARPAAADHQAADSL